MQLLDRLLKLFKPQPHDWKLVNSAMAQMHFENIFTGRDSAERGMIKIEECAITKERRAFFVGVSSRQKIDVALAEKLIEENS